MIWPDVIERAKKIPCDGHVVKMIRALHHGCTICAPYETPSETTAAKFPVKGTEMWLKIANMVLDSTEDHQARWTSGCGGRASRRPGMCCLIGSKIDLPLGSLFDIALYLSTPRNVAVRGVQPAVGGRYWHKTCTRSRARSPCPLTLPIQRHL
jgi:hypothetical protein